MEKLGLYVGIIVANPFILLSVVLFDADGLMLAFLANFSSTTVICLGLPGVWQQGWAARRCLWGGLQEQLQQRLCGDHVCAANRRRVCRGVMRGLGLRTSAAGWCVLRTRQASRSGTRGMSSSSILTCFSRLRYPSLPCAAFSVLSQFT